MTHRSDAVCWPNQKRNRMARTLRVWPALAVAMAAAAACRSEPARITAGASDTILINNRNPIRIPLRVLDAKGQPLGDDEIGRASCRERVWQWVTQCDGDT